MRKALVLGLFTLLAAHSARADVSLGALDLLTSFSAKESCSCAFVVEQTDEFCQAFGSTAGYNVNVKIDHAAKTVTSTFISSTRTARATEAAGCILDELK